VTDKELVEQGAGKAKMEKETSAGEAMIEAEVVEEAPAGEKIPEARAVEEGEGFIAEGEIADLQRELAAAREQAAEYLDGWQRARAELANYKKRIGQDQENARQMANASLLTRLLPVLDDFERAFQTLPPELSGEAWVEGMNLVRRKLQLIVEQEGVTPIETEGQTFDPTYHEAVTHEEADGYAEGQIVAEVQKGYKIGEWVLRPALVRVAK
jgi:molecular chaperone GrpE